MIHIVDWHGCSISHHIPLDAAYIMRTRRDICNAPLSHHCCLIMQAEQSSSSHCNTAIFLDWLWGRHSECCIILKKEVVIQNVLFKGRLAIASLQKGSLQGKSTICASYTSNALITKAGSATLNFRVRSLRSFTLNRDFSVSLCNSKRIMPGYHMALECMSRKEVQQELLCET